MSPSVNRILLVLFLLPMLSRSQVKKKDRFYPADYLFPIKQLAKGKTFVFENIEGTRYMNTDVVPVQKHNKAAFVIKHYFETQTVDSSTCSETWLLIDEYIFLPGATQPIKGKILVDEVIDDGT